MNMRFFWLETLERFTPSLLKGFGVVVEVTILGLLLSLALALVLAIGRMSKSKALRGVLIAFIELIRGTPLLVQLFYIYYVIPLIISWIAGRPNAVTFTSVFAGILGLGINYSRLVQQPHNILRYNPNYFFPDTNDMEFLKNDLALVADLRFKVWRGLMFNIRWQYSIIAVKRDWTFTEVNTDGVKKNVWDNDCYNNSLTFRLLWQF